MVNGRRMDRRMLRDILTQYARIGKSTKRLLRQQSVTRRREGFGEGSIGSGYDPPKFIILELSGISGGHKAPTLSR